jgi:hypothetical protein
VTGFDHSAAEFASNAFSIKHEHASGRSFPHLGTPLPEALITVVELDRSDDEKSPSREQAPAPFQGSTGRTPVGSID